MRVLLRKSRRIPILIILPGLLGATFILVLWNIYRSVVGEQSVIMTEGIQSTTTHPGATSIIERNNHDIQQQSEEEEEEVHNEHRKHEVVYYSRTRPDRSGASIMDMMACHAWAFHRNGTYAGACGDGSSSTTMSSPTTASSSLEVTEYLLKEIGLDGLFTIATTTCPTTTTTSTTQLESKSTTNKSTRTTYIVLEKEEYLLTSQDILIWTPEWLSMIRNHVKYPITTPFIMSLLEQSSRQSQQQQQRQKQPPPYTIIAVHIRRGDVDPCCWPRRYLPNDHYQKLIDRYSTRYVDTGRVVHVVIFSESKTFESFHDFKERGYHVLLDGDPADVWKTMMIADVVILSKSSFSIVPAALNRNGTIVYTELWHKPLPGWDIVDDELLSRTKLERKRLRKACSETILAHCDEQR